MFLKIKKRRKPFETMPMIITGMKRPKTTDISATWNISDSCSFCEELPATRVSEATLQILEYSEPAAHRVGSGLEDAPGIILRV